MQYRCFLVEMCLQDFKQILCILVSIILLFGLLTLYSAKTIIHVESSQNQNVSRQYEELTLYKNYRYNESHCLNKVGSSTPPQMAVFTKVPKTGTTTMLRISLSLINAD